MNRIAFLWPRLLYPGLRREDGQTMAEYAVILAVIVVLALGALTLLSGGISDALNKVKDVLTPSSG